MFSPDVVPPNDTLGPSTFTCPTIRYAKHRTNISDDPSSNYDDQSYFYLGYALLNDDAVEAFAKAYRKQIAEGGSFDEDLVVEDEKGTHVLHRLSDHVDQVLHESSDPYSVSSYEGRDEYDSDYTHRPGVVGSDIPLLIERDLGHRADKDFGRRRGAFVIFLRHGVQYVESGTWPMTEKTQRILAELAELTPESARAEATAQQPSE